MDYWFADVSWRDFAIVLAVSVLVAGLAGWRSAR